jgi:hypothetical protein
MVKLLLELGADPALLDTEFQSTAAGWAEHQGHQEIAAFLTGASRGPGGPPKLM